MDRDSNQTKVINRSISQKMFYERENLCPLCNHELTIKTKVLENNFTIDEEAYCSHCEMVTRSKSHNIN